MQFKEKIKNSSLGKKILVPTVRLIKVQRLRLLGHFNKLIQYAPKDEIEMWQQRIKVVKESSDNENINLVEDAGKIKGRYMTMHNGIKIDPLSYYGYGNLQLLLDNKGVHEPQEEYVFQEVLKHIPPGSTMIELGSYWAFYSMWFYKEVANANCIMYEPLLTCLECGIINFDINGYKGNFNQAFITDKSFTNEKGENFISVDTIIEKNNLDFVSIVHSDIQGHETDMLKGSEESILAGKIGYFFVSTHSNKIHKICLDFLIEKNFVIICEANMDESYSWDGLIVARNPNFEGISHLDISKR